MAADGVPPPGRVRARVRVTGTVQGVGFRPFVYRLASALDLAGFVRNDAAGVEVEVEGAPDAIDHFESALVAEAPPSALVRSVRSQRLAPVGDAGFRVEASVEAVSAGAVRPGGTAGPAARTVASSAVGPDTVSCAACLAEVADPTNRRFRYPFTTCTDCGPRYTVVGAIPYDRVHTTLRSFALCPRCRREYDDPADRRFHHETNVCPDCGPVLRWQSPDGRIVGHGEAALDAAVAALVDGAVVAVKGLGGFHLAVDATAAPAVQELRHRKHRAAKPFAVMVADLATARRLGVLDEAAEAALTSPGGPVVVAARRPVGPAARTSAVVDGVAPGLAELGLMLPPTPLHQMLLDAVGRPIVCTSGNVVEEPVVVDDELAVARLGPLVDGFLTHDRPIHMRADDTVVRATGTGLQVLRRSRGLVPQGFPLPRFDDGEAPAVLAVGGHLKVTVALAAGGRVVASHHVGDLDHLDTRMAFVDAIEHLQRLTGVAPEVVAHDLHPDYPSTRHALEWAATDGLTTVAVQHHHAHLASCLVEHQRPGPVVGLCFDGVGFGPDRSLWGGEVLVGDLAGCRRAGHLRAVPLPGGVAAIREPWRMAAAWVAAAAGPDEAVRRLTALDPRAAAVVALAGSSGAGSATGAGFTTGAGRLFDAVAALVLGRTHAQYEAQAAMELEAAARIIPRDDAPTYPGAVRVADGADHIDGADHTDGADGSAQLVVDPAPLVGALLEDLDAGVAPPLLAAGFHEALGRAAADAAVRVARAEGLDAVVLTGGVFQNARFSEVVTTAIGAEGVEVLVHRDVSPNDGGLSIGQAAVAAAIGAEAPERSR